MEDYTPHPKPIWAPWTRGTKILECKNYDRCLTEICRVKMPKKPHKQPVNWSCTHCPRFKLFKPSKRFSFIAHPDGIFGQKELIEEFAALEINCIDPETLVVPVKKHSPAA